jgi:hypothetical protein
MEAGENYINMSSTTPTLQRVSGYLNSRMMRLDLQVNFSCRIQLYLNDVYE